MLNSLVATETLNNLPPPIHLTSCFGRCPVVHDMANTVITNTIVSGVIFHEQSKTGRYRAVSETGRVFINISDSLTVQLTVCSSSRDPALRVVLQNIFLRLVLTGCSWSGGRWSLTVETVDNKSSTDNCREDSQGDGNNRGDPPGCKVI